MLTLVHMINRQTKQQLIFFKFDFFFTSTSIQKQHIDWQNIIMVNNNFLFLEKNNNEGKIIKKKKTMMGKKTAFVFLKKWKIKNLVLHCLML